MADLRIQYVTVHSVSPSARNPRAHSRKQVRQIARSIQAFGFLNPIVVDEHGQLVAGHGRLLAAQDLGLSRVPVIRVDHLTAAEKRAFMLADNKIAANAGWDPALLRVELEYLSHVDLDVELTGFSMPEIDIVLGAAEAQRPEPPVPPLPAILDAVVKSGDLWRLGSHRLACGDTRDAAILDRVMGGKRARLVFTDPPYNVRIEGHARGKGRHHYPDFQMAAGELTELEFSEFLKASLAQMARASMDGALAYVCMDWRHMSELLTAGKQAFSELVNLCVWNKSSGGMGSLYRSKHELVFVFRKGRSQHLNNVELGKYGRNRTNVWDYPGANAFGEGREEALALHPTVKPVRMVADALLDASKRGDVVLDGFAGSGSTLLAAEQTGREFRGVELDPRYCDVILRRWQKVTGDSPVHDRTGKTYDQLNRARTKRAAGGG